MYQNLQQLKSRSLEEVKAYKDDAVKAKAELEALKANGGKAWTNAKQEELDEVSLFLVDVEEVIAEKLDAAIEGSAVESSAPYYVPEKGTEKMVHLAIVHGRRFNPVTGKEESTPYTQIFTYPEWQLFKKNFARMGYAILKVLHDPYNDAEQYVIKK